MIRRALLLVFLGGAAVCLVPWTVYLADTLPNRFDTGQWRLAWVGFDIALLCCFGAAAWLGMRRHRNAVPMLAATATLLCCDAWFDVLLDWTSPDRWTSLALAAGAELPIALFLLVRARALLLGGLPEQRLTVLDIATYRHRPSRRVLGALGRLGPSRTAELAEALAENEGELAVTLAGLHRAGYLRLGLDNRWRAVPRSVAEPKPEDYAEADREQVAAYLDAKYANELKLLTWAAAHRTEFGPWGKGHRATGYLSPQELAAFDREYRELLLRYCLRHPDPTPGTREIAIRMYAFTPPEDPMWTDDDERPQPSTPDMVNQ